jgi:GMP synthase-like glutamine amidotransferase
LLVELAAAMLAWMRFLIVQHDEDKGLGLLAEPLREQGAELDVRMAGRDRVELDGHAAVIALPGLADPVDGTVAVDTTREVLRAALGRGLPTLGICLGAELLAEAAGARVRACPPEFGYCRVLLDPASASDPLFHDLPTELEVFQAHGYATELPEEAVSLARSEHSLQAFRLGEHAWGVQFHPEPTAEMIASWVGSIDRELARSGIRPDEVLARARVQVPVWTELGSRIAERFGRVVAANARPV